MTTSQKLNWRQVRSEASQKAQLTRTAAYNKALRRLRQLHPDEFDALYQEERKRIVNA